MTGPGADDAAGDRTLDGNALAGPLLELFAVDLLPAQCTCAHCGASSPLAGHRLYTDSPALVLRCPDCTGVVLRYSSVGGSTRLELTGARLLVFEA